MIAKVVAPSSDSWLHSRYKEENDLGKEYRPVCVGWVTNNPQNLVASTTTLLIRVVLQIWARSTDL